MSEEYENTKVTIDVNLSWRNRFHALFTGNMTISFPISLLIQAIKDGKEEAGEKLNT